MFASNQEINWHPIHESKGGFANGKVIIDKGCVSHICIMKSNAGFYIGTAFKHVEDDGRTKFIEPNERMSHYMSEDEAIKELPKYKD